jgi:Ca2+-binding EF-hand superfamily protein
LRIAVYLMIAAAAALNAQPERGGFIRFHPLLSALDGNHDGVIDSDELAKAPAALRALDRNQDGRITPEEMRPAMGRGGGGFEGRGRPEGGARGADPTDEAVKSYLAFDKNGDGKLTRDEVPERMQGIFERGDTNHDGILTADELRAMARTQQQPSVEGRGRGEGGRGREGMMRMDPIFSALDTNHDGVIEGDEISNAASALKTLDTNHDGKLTEDELRPNFGRGRG